MKLPAHQWRGPNGFRVWPDEGQYFEYQTLDYRVQYLNQRQCVTRDQVAFRTLIHPFLWATMAKLILMYRQVAIIDKKEWFWLPETFRREPHQLGFLFGDDQSPEKLKAQMWTALDKVMNSRAYFESKWWLLYAWYHLEHALITSTWAPLSGSTPAGNFPLTYFHIWQFNQVLEARENYQPITQPHNDRILRERHPHVLRGIDGWPLRLQELALTRDQLTTDIPDGMTPEMCGIDPEPLYRVPLCVV